ncbi:MAG: hypothetical protein JW751_32490 [Polyangiaceae bacterium]|nr:hypothetical protein [Polyangiaceae bacterium]
MAVPVAPGAFATRAHEILLHGEATTERRNRLAGVVAAQLSRAEARFAAGNVEDGMRAVEGAFLMVRALDDDPALYAAHSSALMLAADACARGGSEGRALALYERLDGLLPTGPAQTDVRGHLDALARWREFGRSENAVAAASFDQRLWSSRAVFDPSNGTLRSAQQATIDWVTLALDVDPSSLDLEDPKQRATALDAYAALQGGSSVIVAIHLRHGDATGALDALGKGAFAEIAPPALVARVQAASAGDAKAWSDLYGLFAAAAEAPGNGLPVGQEVVRAAAWGAAVELFRARPDATPGTLPLAGLLPSYGMSEVMPLVLADGLGPEAREEEVGPALALLLGAMATESAAGRIEVARATFEAARPILTLAERAAGRGEVRPNPARVHYAMAALEIRHAEVARARPHLIDTLRIAPYQYDALTLLAAVERQRRDDRSALDALERAARIAAKSGGELASVETLLTTYEIHRDIGAPRSGEPMLRAGLNASLTARETARSSRELARAERLLARALEHYAAAEAAQDATLRALDAARSDLDELSATLIDGMRRALTLGLVPFGRELAREAIADDLDDEDLVYIALWLRLLEGRGGVGADGTAAEALAKVDARDGWVARLRDWATGGIDDAALVEAARSAAEQAEARFYTTMARPGTPDAASLRSVAESPAIGLVEVMIARDLLASLQSTERLSLPANLVLP